MNIWTVFYSDAVRSETCNGDPVVKHHWAFREADSREGVANVGVLLGRILWVQRRAWEDLNVSVKEYEYERPAIQGKVLSEDHPVYQLLRNAAHGSYEACRRSSYIQI